MQYRGPILIVFAMSLVLSPVAILALQKAEDDESIVSRIRTMGQIEAECAAESIQTRTMVIGCAARTQNTGPRRTVTAGGALFVAARN